MSDKLRIHYFESGISGVIRKSVKFPSLSRCRGTTQIVWPGLTFLETETIDSLVRGIESDWLAGNLNADGMNLGRSLLLHKALT